MGTIKHNLLPKQRSRKNGLKVDIELFSYAQELYDELNRIGIIDRVKTIPQLGLIKVPKKLSKTRYDYLMLQLYIHQIIRKKLSDKLRYSYGNQINKSEFSNHDLQNNGNDKVSVGDILQIMTIVYNIGHFYDTFTASRAIMLIASEDDTFKSMLLNASLDQRYKSAVNKLIEEKNYQRFHLLNSILVLEKCDKSRQSISLAIEILYAYINQKTLTEKSKLPYVFNVFRIVRNVSYMAYDLQIANTPLIINICDDNAMIILLQELLAEYNNNQSSYKLIESIGKLLDDTVYNENSNAICYYRISRKMVNSLARNCSCAEMDYYSDLFFNRDSILNRKYERNKDFVKEQILKLTFSEKDRELSEKLLVELERINNTRVGYYDRHTGETTILVSIKKSCDYRSKVGAAFKTLKCVIKYLRKITEITFCDVRYLLCTKFFLFYFLEEHPVEIKPTIDKEKCVFCARGKNKHVKEINSLIEKDISNDDEKHEAQFLLKCLKTDMKSDISICIPASITVYEKTTILKTLCEFDGMIIYPMRKEEQIIFLEAKNTDKRPSYGKNCLAKKLDKLGINYNSDDIKIVDHDAVFRYTLK